MNAIFWNHSQERCGVYQMGRRIGTTLAQSGVAMYCEATDLRSAIAHMQSLQPRVAIYNWHPSTIPWAPEIVRRFPQTKHVGLIHEISPEAPATGAEIFPYRIVCDPEFPIDGTRLFRSIRHVPRVEAPRPTNETMTVGSFGFAVGGKMFSAIVQAVGSEFPGAIVRLRIPHAAFGDNDGGLAQAISNAIRAVTSSNVNVEISHEFLGEDDLVRWLAANDLNVFFYEPNGGRGISSVIDYAVAARRPIAINDSQMFRHLGSRIQSYPSRSLRESLDSGDAVEAIYQEWSPERLVHDYRHMLGVLGVG